MRKLLALCLFIACLPGCGKATEREGAVDSEQTIRSNADVTEPFTSKDRPSPSPENDSDQANLEADTKLEPLSSPKKTDNSQFTRQRVRENRDHSTTKEEILARIAPRLSRSSADLPVTYGSDGQMVIHLKGRFSHVALAKKMPDGTIRQTCVDNIKSARAFLSSSERPAKE